MLLLLLRKKQSSSFAGSSMCSNIFLRFVTVESKQRVWQTWTEQSLHHRYACVGFQLNSDRALRLIFLNGHVRARSSMLWQHRWQEASEFLCTKTPIFGGIWATQKITETPRKCFSNALITSRFQDFAAAAWFLKPCFVRFCLIKLITELIRCQRFWEVIFFTGIRVCNFAHPQIEEMQWCLRSLCRYRIWQARQRYINKNPKMYEESCKHFRLCWKPQSICIVWSYWIDYSILKVNLKASDAVWFSPALMLVVLLLSNLACVYKCIYVTWCMYSMYIWPYLCESRVCVSACRVMLRCCCWYGFSGYFQ